MGYLVLNEPAPEAATIASSTWRGLHIVYSRTHDCLVFMNANVDPCLDLRGRSNFKRLLLQSRIHGALYDAGTAACFWARTWRRR